MFRWFRYQVAKLLIKRVRFPLDKTRAEFHNRCRAVVLTEGRSNVTLRSILKLWWQQRKLNRNGYLTQVMSVLILTFFVLLVLVGIKWAVLKLWGN
jgi:hypothetical protein